MVESRVGPVFRRKSEHRDFVAAPSDCLPLSSNDESPEPDMIASQPQSVAEQSWIVLAEFKAPSAQKSIPQAPGMGEGALRRSLNDLDEWDQGRGRSPE
jgi:hypothetical protein